MYLIIVFKVGLHPYIQLSITRMKREMLMEHKETIVICEKNGPKVEYNFIFSNSNKQNV